MSASFYVIDGRGLRATDAARGPWSNEAQHGGPPSALLVRALEVEMAAGGWALLSRLTVEILRPVPLAGLHTVHVDVQHAGRSAGRMRARLEVEGRTFIEATALALAGRGLDPAPEGVDDPIPGPETVEPTVFPFFKAPDGYHTAVEQRPVMGEWGRTPTVTWMRPRVPLVAGESMSPTCRAVIGADSGNGLSPVVDWRTHGFVNPDLTVTLWRPPVGEWVAYEARTDVAPSGLGVARTRLRDIRGPLGYGLQTLLVHRVD